MIPCTRQASQAEIAPIKTPPLQLNGESRSCPADRVSRTQFPDRTVSDDGGQEDPKDESDVSVFRKELKPIVMRKDRVPGISTIESGRLAQRRRTFRVRLPPGELVETF